MDSMPKKFNHDRVPRPRVEYGVFNESYDHKFTCNSGELIPCYWQEVFPGDKMSYKNAFLVKSLPLVTPVMADYYIYSHFWFVPYRILQSHETIEKGLDANTFEDYINATHESDTIPLIWSFDSDDSEYVLNLTKPIYAENVSGNFAYCQVPANKYGDDETWDYSLLDYLQIYTGKPLSFDDGFDSIHQFLVRAYNVIWNTKYRNEDVQDTTYSGVDGSTFARTDGVTIGVDILQTNILRRNWERDYFTSALPWLQKGTPIALPVTSTLDDSHVWWTKHGEGVGYVGGNNTLTPAQLYGGDSGGSSSDNYLIVNPKVTSTAFDINNLREANAIQRFLEANARGGTKYHEFCKAHFGVAPRDEALNIPLYLGGSKSPLIISEVTQTNASTLSDSTPQGTVTGKAESADSQFLFKETFYEHGVVMGLFSIMPKPVYSNGVSRQLVKRDFFDWYSPEFAHLGEQEILAQEANQADDSPTDNNRIIGYIGRWSEMRERHNVVSGGFRSNASASSGFYGGMSDWTVSKSSFTLNSANLVCNPVERFWAFPKSSGNKNFIVDFGNIVKMARPLPYEPEPMLVG